MTNCTTVEAVYTYGELVWNMGPSVWYVSWLPESLSGSFWMDRIPRNLEDYSGYYSWEGSGMITEGAFRTAGFTYMNTNVKLIENASTYSSGAFAACRSLSVVDMPRCSMIGSYAFNGCYSLSVVNMSRCKYIGERAFMWCSTLESINLPRCSYIGRQAFNNCSSLSQVSLPVCEYVGSSAFEYCSSLSQVSLPVCEYVGWTAFYNCSRLNSVYLPVCSYISNYAFHGCSSLTSIDLPMCSYIGNSAFYDCYSLSQVSLPVCEYVGDGAFFDCSSLTSIDLPMCSYIGNTAFRAWGWTYVLSYISLPVCEYVGGGAFISQNLKSIDLPMCSYIGNTAFGRCSSLSKVNLPVCGQIGSHAFSNCTSLSLLVLGSNSVVSIDSSYHTFEKTPFSRCSGSILVPVELLNDYLTAPGWSSLSCVIYSIPNTYINWTPAYLSGSFKMEGNTYNLEDYGGSFIWGNGIIDNYAFYSTGIQTIETNAFSIGSHAFDDCVSLGLLVLKNDSVVSIDSSYHTFKNTPFSRCSGSILVPEELLNDYLTAPEWSSLSCVIYSIPITYINWTPTNLSGSFKMEGNTYKLEDYGGSFIWSNGGIIDNYAFYRTGIQTMETNAFCIGFGAFEYCSSLSQANLSMCKYVDPYAFAYCSSLSQVSLPMCEYVGYSAFVRCSSLSQVSLPVCSYIGNYAFWDCYSLTQANLPMCSYVGIAAFAYCSSLSQVSIPVCSYVGIGAFAGCDVLSVIQLPECTYIGRSAFRGCDTLWSVFIPECVKIDDGSWDDEDGPSGVFAKCGSLNVMDLPKCEYLGSGAFAYCSNLTDVDLPVCSYVGHGAFQGCWNLTEIDLPECKYLGSYVFRRAEDQYYTSASMKLSYINLPNCSYIGSQCFKDCRSFGRITLGYSGVCVLQSTDAFYNTPISSIYVPASLVDAYKSDSVWSYFSNMIYSIT